MKEVDSSDVVYTCSIFGDAFKFLQIAPFVILSHIP